MQRYAIIHNGLVVNVVEYETQPDNPPPGFDSGYIAVQSDVAGPGFTYANEIFTPNQPYPSWVLVDNKWEAPIAPPNETDYMWDEETTNWKKVK